ncbi:MAG TPA: hypothetical protein VIV40_23570 [Kofleriaceae bacterium]
MARVVALASLVAASPALAQAPPPQPPTAPQDPSKMDAKALMQTGVRLLEAKDYLGALALFREAYTRFASAKILLNIGTTLKLLDRRAEAANTYQRYLDSSDADPTRTTQVVAELAELDKSLGIVEVIVRPADAEVKLGDEWLPAARAKLWRLTPGPYAIGARKPGFQNAEATGSITAGQKTSVTLALVEVPKQSAIVGGDDLMIVEKEQPRSRLGAFAMIHVSVVPKLGSAALVGATFDLMPQLGLDAAVLLGPGLVSDGMATRPPPSFGGYLGANYAFLPGAVRPRAGAGMTVFSSDGARFQVRGAGGLEYVASRNISVTVEVGAEVAINPEDDIRELAIVPALAVAGRL